MTTEPRFFLRYRPDTDLGRRFPTTRNGPLNGFPTREAAEEIRDACINGDQMEVVQK